MNRFRVSKGMLMRVGALTAFYTLFILLRIPCLSVEFFGVPCPGCGMTRALASALRFDFRAAFSYHFMWISLPVLGLYILYDNAKVFKSKRVNAGVFVSIVIGFIINYAFTLSEFFGTK